MTVSLIPPSSFVISFSPNRTSNLTKLVIISHSGNWSEHCHWRLTVLKSNNVGCTCVYKKKAATMIKNKKGG